MEANTARLEAEVDKAQARRVAILTPEEAAGQSPDSSLNLPLCSLLFSSSSSLPQGAFPI